MLDEHKKICKGKLGDIGDVSHRILLKYNDRPTHENPFRGGPTGRKIFDEEFKIIIKEEFIEPTQSEWASPVVFVSKPDVSVLFRVYYRCLKSLTERDTYPLPKMDECIDTIGEADIFTTLDCN